MNGSGRWNESIPFGRLEEMFGEWARSLRENRPHGSVWAQATREDAPWRGARVRDEPADDIRVDEYREGGVHVVRAALPGIDPEQDVEITADHGELRIVVERRADEREYLRHELRPGRSSRSLPLPERADTAQITASYRDGILEIRVPSAEPAAAEPTRITVTRS